MCENCECKNLNTVHWFDASGSVIPLNNSISLISPVQSLAGLHFFATDNICVALQISEQFCLKARTLVTRQPIRCREIGAKTNF